MKRLPERSLQSCGCALPWYTDLRGCACNSDLLEAPLSAAEKKFNRASTLFQVKCEIEIGRFTQAPCYLQR